MHANLTFATLLAGVVSRWRTVAYLTVGVILVGSVLALVLPPTYRSSASFVTTEAEVRFPQGLDNIAGGAGLGGIAQELGLGSGRDPSESPAFYFQLLRSRELLTRLLMSRFPDPRTREAADSATLLELTSVTSSTRERALERGVKRMRRTLRVSFDAKTNLVDVDAEAQWPGLSAAIANRAMELVSAFNKEQRVSRAQALRAFLEDRVVTAQAELGAAENALRTFYEKNRSWQNSPGLVVDERRLRRQVETVSDLYLSLRREYESARIDEVNTTPVITIVDRAVPPQRPYWPRWEILLVTSAALGVGLGLLWAAAREVAGHWAVQNPEDAQRLQGAVARASRDATELLRRPARTATKQNRTT
jgi:uncharacterized protein involved in exopolysaccharide biosynthesis